MSNRWKVYKTADGRIALDMQGDYSVRANNELKNLPVSGRWHKSTKTWRFALRWEACTGIRQVANGQGRDLEIGPSLKEWARAEKARQATIPDVQSVDAQKLPRLESVHPATAKAIATRGFQTVGAKFIATNRSALIADDPGLGKTLQTIAGIVEADVQGPVLVVGPTAAVGITWPAEIELWAPGEPYILIDSDVPAKERNERVLAAQGSASRIWVLVSPGYLRIRAETDEWGKYKKGPNGKKIIDYVAYAVPAFFEIEWAACVVDESHLILAGCTGNVKKQSAQRQGIGALRIREHGTRVAMSGTPMRGKEDYIWGQLNWLRPDIYTSYWKFVEKHFDIYGNGFGREIGSLKSEDDLYAEARRVMLRRTKAEAAPDMPEKTYGGTPLHGYDRRGNAQGPIAVWLPMAGPQRRQYRQMVKNAVADLKGGRCMANGALPQTTRLRQLACSAGEMRGEELIPVLGSNKYDWLVNFLEERGIAGTSPTGDGKVIVTSQFTKLLELFSVELAKIGVESMLFTGKTSKKKRRHIKATFQNEGGPRVILLNMQSGGTSLTLDAADDVVVLDEPWNRDDETQVVDRAHRISKYHRVTVWRLRTLGTIEVEFAERTAVRDRGIRTVLDGSRGINFLEKAIEREAA